MNLLSALAIHVGSVLLILAMGHDWPVPARLDAWFRRQGR